MHLLERHSNAGGRAGMLRSGNAAAETALTSLNENTDDAGRVSPGNIGAGASAWWRWSRGESVKTACTRYSNGFLINRASERERRQEGRFVQTFVVGRDDSLLRRHDRRPETGINRSRLNGRLMQGRCSPGLRTRARFATRTR